MKKKYYILGIVFIILGILLDQIVKIIIRLNLPEGDFITIIKGFFDISHIENTGAAWGGFSGYTIILIIVSLVILGYFIYIYKNIDFKNKKVFSISLVFVISGTIGNLIDRLIFRSVTDFFDFTIFAYDFPVFNIADILLVIGFALFLIDMIFFDDVIPKDKKEKDVVDENVTNDEIDLADEEKEDDSIENGGDSLEGRD